MRWRLGRHRCQRDKIYFDRLRHFTYLPRDSPASAAAATMMLRRPSCGPDAGGASAQNVRHRRFQRRQRGTGSQCNRPQIMLLEKLKGVSARQSGFRRSRLRGQKGGPRHRHCPSLHLEFGRSTSSDQAAQRHAILGQEGAAPICCRQPALQRLPMCPTAARDTAATLARICMKRPSKSPEPLAPETMSL